MIGSKLHRFNEVDSTNDVAMELAEKGAVEGEVVIARSQKKGRGRAGRGWESSSDNNVYMSVILRPDSLPNIACITLVTGIAVAEALKNFAEGELKVKWPNDIWLNGKKLCGILAEKGDTFVVVGVGVNVNSTFNEFSPEVGRIATSLAIESGRKYDVEKVIASICREFERSYASLKSEGFRPFKKLFDKWSLVNGKRISVTFGKDVRQGMASGIDDDGALLLENDGAIQRVIAGDVNICS